MTIKTRFNLKKREKGEKKGKKKKTRARYSASFPYLKSMYLAIFISTRLSANFILSIFQPLTNVVASVPSHLHKQPHFSN